SPARMPSSGQSTKPRTGGGRTFETSLGRVGSERSEGGPRPGQGWEEKRSSPKPRESGSLLGGRGGREARVSGAAIQAKRSIAGGPRPGDPDRGRAGKNPPTLPTGGRAPWKLGRGRSVSVPLVHRYFFPAELEALLQYNGFIVE